NRYYIFGRDGGKELAEELDIPLLGQIPLIQSICERGDGGEPIATDRESLMGIYFRTLARNVAEQIEQRNASQAPTQRVEIHK
ncbi:MAG: P-loop NTPase, partial [Porphyromonas sp.]